MFLLQQFKLLNKYIIYNEFIILQQNNIIKKLINHSVQKEISQLNLVEADSS